MRGSITRTVLSVFAAVDCTFKLLISLSFLAVLGVTRDPERTIVLGLIAALNVLPTLAWLGLLFALLRPIARWQRAVAAGTESDVLVEQAALAVYTVPRRFALGWMAHWLLVLD